MRRIGCLPSLSGTTKTEQIRCLDGISSARSGTTSPPLDAPGRVGHEAMPVVRLEA